MVPVNRPTAVALVFAGLTLTTATFGQGEGETKLISRPDVMIRVQKAPVGADYVTIQMVAENYPPDLLKAQCERVGALAGTGSRGIEITTVPTGTSPSGKPSTILNASFATDGLIDRATGVLRLLPFAKAFAGNEEEHKIECLAVSFVQEVPRQGVTIGNLENDSVRIEGAYDATHKIVDFRVYLLIQDPEKIEFPESLQAQTIRTVAPSNGAALRLIPWIVGGAVLAGLLVYFALRPAGKKPPAKPNERPR
jgi:hypothetical protein